jgi:hypothetical protein
MEYWTNFLANPKSLTSIFSTPPSLENIRLLRLHLDENGPTLRLEVDINDYPDTPPPKWKEQGFNQVQLQLSFFPIESINITGWCTDNVGLIEFKSTETGIAVIADMATLSLRFECESCFCDKVSGYLNSTS